MFKPSVPQGKTLILFIIIVILATVLDQTVKSRELRKRRPLKNGILQLGGISSYMRENSYKKASRNSE